MKFKKIYLMLYFSFCLFIWGNTAMGQMMARDYRVHERGMLHQTVYNTGSIGTYWDRNLNRTTLPLMEWPSNSAFTYQAIEYDGQHNSWGGAIFISANIEGKYGFDLEDGRLFAFCGGVGKADPEPPYGRWSFPISINKVTNFPLNDDGTINENYNPNEAEEIITAKWATSVGITVTRVSRQWSFPDYDDMIIYEFELENTGDFNGDEVPDSINTLVDVFVQFQYGFAPSMYGFQRYHDYEWEKQDNMFGNWDPTYWLHYVQVLEIFGDSLRCGRPEPDPANFPLYANSRLYGGGLTSPQAPGFCMLYYDTDKLAIIDRNDPNRNQSVQFVNEQLLNWDSLGHSYMLDDEDKVKQPWSSYEGKKNTQLDKMYDKIHRINDPYGKLYKDELNPTYWIPDPKWVGRMAPHHDGFKDRSPTRGFGFAPYYMEPGDKIEFAYAEVVGYGARPGHRIVGGLVAAETSQPVRANGWDRPMTVSANGNTVHTDNYIQEFGYPDYVNSDVRTVQDVAEIAYEAYSGHEIDDPSTWEQGNPQYWPEDNPKDGVYNIPVPIPAPKISIINTDSGTVSIKWARYVEDFENIFPSAVSGHLVKFNVYRSDIGIGPYKLIGSVQLGNVTGENIYDFADLDRNFKVGETKYYYVTSVDENGYESGRTNLINHTKNIGAVPELGKVYVAPNPFVLRSGFSGNAAENMLGFYALPTECTIYIFSFAGQRVMEIKHNVPLYADSWEQITLNSQDIASGVYFYVVKTPDGKKSTGKFIVIK